MMRQVYRANESSVDTLQRLDLGIIGSSKPTPQRGKNPAAGEHACSQPPPRSCTQWFRNCRSQFPSAPGDALQGQWLQHRPSGGRQGQGDIQGLSDPSGDAHRRLGLLNHDRHGSRFGASRGRGTRGLRSNRWLGFGSRGWCRENRQGRTPRRHPRERCHSAVIHTVGGGPGESVGAGRHRGGGGESHLERVTGVLGPLPGDPPRGAPGCQEFWSSEGREPDRGR
jgi:hypothetical protein